MSDQKSTEKKAPSHLFEGEFMAKAVTPDIGTWKGKKKVRVTMKITSPGERQGWTIDYEGKLDTDNIKYTKRAMIALGWKGQTSATFIQDVLAADREVPITVRIARFTRDDGTVREWSAIDKIGRYTPPLEKLDADGVRDMDSWFAEVRDDAPAANGQHQSGGDGAPADDLPF